MKHKSFWTILFIYLFAASLVEARTVKIAILDSGLNNTDKSIPVCQESKNFTNEPLDKIGHGTNISNIIHKISYGANYCQVILKIFDKPLGNGLGNTIAALKYLNAMKVPVDIVNYSAGGKSPSETERVEIRQLLDKGVLFVSAAGNENNDFDLEGCNYYPACYYSEIIVVGNITEKGKRYGNSNYGAEVDLWATGVNVQAGGYTMTGTSQAAAIVSGQGVTFLDKTYNKRTPQGGETDMPMKSAEAFYIQTGLREYTQAFYDKNIDKSTRSIVEHIIPLSKMVMDRKFTIEKSF